jgi:hypothetical protein
MEITLENLKKLMAEIDLGSTEGIEGKNEKCWRYF